MLRKFILPQQIFKNCRTYPYLHVKKFSTEEEKPNRETFSKDYLKNIKQQLNDFQNEFGFDESLKEIRLENIKLEKRLSRGFQIFVLIIGSAVLSTVIISLSDDGSRKMKKFYHTHSTNILIKASDLLPGMKSSKVKLSLIRNYVSNMKEGQFKNPVFASILLEEVNSILAKLIMMTEGMVIQNRKINIPIQNFTESADLTLQLLEMIDENKNSDIRKRVSKVILRQILNTMTLNLELDKNTYDTLLNVTVRLFPVLEKPVELLDVLKALNFSIDHKRVEMSTINLNSLQILCTKASEHIVPIGSIENINLDQENFFEYKKSHETYIKRAISLELIMLIKKMDGDAKLKPIVEEAKKNLRKSLDARFK